MMLSEETSAVRPQKQTRFNGAKLVWMLKGSPLTVTGAVIIVLMLLMMIFHRGWRRMIPTPLI